MKVNFETTENILRECTTLDELFEEWREAHKNETDFEMTTVDGIGKNSFESDGYISYEKYSEAPIKTLFILKEANIKKYTDEMNLRSDERNQFGFYRNYILNNVGLNRPKQQEKIGRMANYLIEGMTEKSKIPTEQELKTSLEKCAFINMNKRGGGEHTNNAKFAAYIEKYKLYIKRQIEIINPDYIIIIGRSCANSFLKNICAANDKKVIEMWHTAYRMSGVRRSDNPIYTYKDHPDKNVDCYMKFFFEICSNLFKQ